MVLLYHELHTVLDLFVVSPIQIDCTGPWLKARNPFEGSSRRLSTKMMQVIVLGLAVGFTVQENLAENPVQL